MARAVMNETAIFQQSSAVACQKLNPPLGAAMVVVHLVIKPLAWKAHQMKMVNQTEREDKWMSQDIKAAGMAEVAKIAKVASKRSSQYGSQCTDSDELQWTYGNVQHSAEGQATPRHLPTFSCPHGPTPRTKQATMPLQTFQLLLTKVIFGGDCLSNKDRKKWISHSVMKNCWPLLGSP